jgi:uroporphyrinogen III methyltransferase/synthase
MFTSANGVEFFFRRLEEKCATYPDDLISTFAIGPATARALKERNARVDLIAEDSKAEGALAAIIVHMGSEEKLRGIKFLIPRAQAGRDFLPDELTRLGAHVDVAKTYRTVKSDIEGSTVIKMFEEQTIDAITFTSSSTVSNFAAILGIEDLSALLEKTLVACIGPTTTATASKHGLRHVLQPQTHTTPALVKAIIESLGNK